MAKDEGTFWVDEEAGELVLNNEGEEERFYIDEEMELEGNRYLVLIPAVEDEEADEALVLKLIEEEDDQILSIIEDDEEFARVKEKYLQS